MKSAFSRFKNWILLATMLAFAGVVYAATERVERDGSSYPMWFHKGFYVGPYVPDPTSTTTNKVTRMLSASATIDFATATIVCRDSAAISVPGAQVNDPCFVGMPSTLTAGGTGLHESFTCYVSAADNVKVRACAAGTADDPASAIFVVRVISNI